jgi:hypothetical protein
MTARLFNRNPWAMILVSQLRQLVAIGFERCDQFF